MGCQLGTEVANSSLVRLPLLPLLSIVLLSLAACVAPAPGPGEEVGGTAEALRACADSPGIRGIDVSHWQGTINWDRVAGDHIKFAIIRIADGTGTFDDQFDRNWRESRRVGVLRGAYQFFRPNQDPIAQADLFLRHLGTLETDDLSPVIDVEVTGGRSPAQIRTAMRSWIDRVEGATGRKVVIYTGPYFWQTNLNNTAAFADNPLWIANWGVSCPSIPDAWSDWAFWQTSSTGSIAGISGNVDTDVFDGTVDELRAFGGPRCTAHCEGTTIVGDDCGMGDCAAFGSRCVDDSRGVRCAFAFCPDVGEADVCIDDTTIGHCTDGAVETGDCADGGGICSTAGRTDNEARCVSALCVTGPDEAPVAHDGCADGGQLVHCDAEGQATTEACAEGEACSMLGGAAHCAPIVCPATGEADVCADAETLAHCSGGSVATTQHCDAGCSTDGEVPSCTSPVEAPPDSPMGTGLEGSRHIEGSVGCDATGVAGGGGSLPSAALFLLALLGLGRWSKRRSD